MSGVWAPDHLCFTVQGRPAPQGSKRSVGRGIMLEMSPHVKAWRQAVSAAAVAACVGRSPLTGPVVVEVTFTIARPKAHYGTGRNALTLRGDAPGWPVKPPDVDKLLRATGDSLSGVVFVDDAQVVELTGRKVYPGGLDSVEGSGAVVRVQAVSDPTQDYRQEEKP